MIDTDNIIFNWSGGKDSALALYKLLQSKAKIQCLLTNFSERYQRVSMHGVRMELMDAQARAIGLPLEKLMVPETPTMENYEHVLKARLEQLKAKGAATCAFGDIFLEDLKQYREERLSAIGMKAIFPIWKEDCMALVNEFIQVGFKSVIVCVDALRLDKSFVGRVIDEALIAALPANVDPCGENGEFHSFVFDGPIFDRPIPVTTGEIIYRRYTDENPASTINSGFWYCDLLPA